MKKIIVVFTCSVMLFAGCAKIDRLENRNKELNQELAAKDQFIEEVTTSINDIHTTLENTWALEKNIVSRTNKSENAGSESLTPVELKTRIINRISDIRTLLASNRKKISSLERKLRGSSRHYAGLEKMVAELKRQLEARDESINVLNARVMSLNDQIYQKDNIIKAHETTIIEKDRMINDQINKMNTVYYAIGKRSELKKEGIVENDGGVLWGLMGTTTVLNSKIDDSQFQHIDKRKATTIPVSGTIKEIVPKRDDSSYTIEQGDDGQSVLVIFHPEDFWKEKHLAVVVD